MAELLPRFRSVCCSTTGMAISVDTASANLIIFVVNATDPIEPALCSLSYISVNEVAKAAMNLGKGALLAKVDIKNAYRLIPVHPADRNWLGMQWNNSIYVDGMLPFGLRSAPKIFTAVADALEWCITKKGAKQLFHYLDDFAIIGPAESDECQRSLDTLIQTCTELGVPLAKDKQEGPTCVVTFLGIVIDTICGELRLPGINYIAP